MTRPSQTHSSRRATRRFGWIAALPLSLLPLSLLPLCLLPLCFASTAGAVPPEETALVQLLSRLGLA
ncbi:MAG: hypothetical protein QGG36_29810, partial [Pirellulaceae bacterium]|nr:hypothetical protein [Pirellulaceae bacterium]